MKQELRPQVSGQEKHAEHKNDSAQHKEDWHEQKSPFQVSLVVQKDAIKEGTVLRRKACFFHTLPVSTEEAEEDERYQSQDREKDDS